MWGQCVKSDHKDLSYAQASIQVQLHRLMSLIIETKLSLKAERRILNRKFRVKQSGLKPEVVGGTDE